VTDNLNPHSSESLVRYIAEQCGIEIELGVKGRHGILQSLQTRQDFLTDKSHRIGLSTHRSIAVGSIKLRSGLERCEGN
jgi:hypothetical protein